MARVILKVSGEQLGSEEYNFDNDRAYEVCDVIEALVRAGNEVACVMGGGNIVRGDKLAKNGFPNPVVADHMGLLATLQNGLFITEILANRGHVEPRLMSKFEATGVAERFSYKQAESHMGKGRVLLLAGGTGNP